MRGLVVTGTDTNVGKTVVAAMLTQALGGVYFKPVQAGTEDETDRETVKRLTGLGGERVLDEAYVLSRPLSPHRAAELDGVEIDPQRLAPPQNERPLIVEGAGGLFVPVNRDTLFVDLFAVWGLSLVLTARTGLGTLNHTLLSLEALRARNIDVLGVAFVGDDNADNMRTIAEMGNVKILGRVPMLDAIDTDTLARTFETHFALEDFAGAR